MSPARGRRASKERGRRERVRARPLVTLKAAVTLDGRIAAHGGDSKWISSEPSRRHAHRMRAQSDAVLVGVGTVLQDDPELTVRMVRGRQPLRVVLDARLRTPPESRIAAVDTQRRTLIFHGPRAPLRRGHALAARGVELCEVACDARGRLRLSAVLRELSRRGVVQLLVEGGSRVHGAFLEQGLADRAAVFVAPRILADPAAIPLASGKKKTRITQAFELSGTRVRRFGPDVLIEGAVLRKRL